MPEFVERERAAKAAMRCRCATCPTCEGLGRWVDLMLTPDGSERVEVLVVCASCEGTGKAPAARVAALDGPNP